MVVLGVNDRIWVPPAADSKCAVPLGSQVVDATAEGAVVVVDDEGRRRTLDAESRVRLMDPSTIHPPADLVELGDLHEAAEIYSQAGRVLIAVNPFEQLGIYTPAFRLSTPLEFLIGDEEDGIGRRILDALNVIKALGNARTTTNQDSSRVCISSTLFFNFCGDVEGGRFEGTSDRKHQAPEGDAAAFRSLCDSLTNLKFSEAEIRRVFSLLAALLQLGNLRYVDSTDGVQLADSKQTELIARLLQVDGRLLAALLTTHEKKAGGEEVGRPLTLDEALNVRDALIRSIYANLLFVLVERLNDRLQGNEMLENEEWPRVTIVDPRGFESAQHNRLDQLVVNAANECLYHAFTRRIKQDHAEYEAQKIGWNFPLEFADNSAVVDLLVAERTGLLELIEAESENPQPAAELSRVFGVRHFVGPSLRYTTGNWLDVRRDHLGGCLQALGRSTGCSLLRAIAEESKKKRTPADEIRELIAQLEHTQPNFVRCIRPNRQQEAGRFDRATVVEQMRAADLMSTVHFEAAGFPARHDYASFVDRFPRPPEIILTVMLGKEANFCLGKTRILLKNADDVALERAAFRSQQLVVSFVDLRHRVVRLQAAARGLLFRRRLDRLPTLKAFKAAMSPERNEAEEKRSSIRKQADVGEECPFEKYAVVHFERAAIILSLQIRRFMGDLPDVQQANAEPDRASTIAPSINSLESGTNGFPTPHWVQAITGKNVDRNWANEPMSEVVRAQIVVGYGILRPALRDEIYAQLLAQLNGNPKTESVERGWLLLALCAGCFLPSADLLDVVREFARQNASEIFTPWPEAQGDEAAVELVYSQEVATLAAVQLFVKQNGRTSVEVEELERELPHLLPKSKRKSLERELEAELWVQRILCFYRKKFSIEQPPTVFEAKAEVVSFARTRWPLHFSRNAGILAVNAGGVQLLAQEESNRVLLEWTFPEITGIVACLSKRSGFDSVTIQTVDGDEFTFQSAHSADIRELIVFFIDGLRKRSPFRLLTRDLRNVHEFRAGDLLRVVDGPAEATTSAEFSGEWLENTRTKKMGRVPEEHLLIIPTLHPPSAQLLEKLKERNHFRPSHPHRELWRHGQEPLEAPLLSRLSERPALCELAVNSFALILRFMGDWPTMRPFDPLELTDGIFEGALKHEALRDELFCQLLKQLTDNPNATSEALGWRLLWLALGLFAPSKRLHGELTSFLRTRQSQRTAECVERLNETVKWNVQRKSPPHRVELEAISTGATRLFHKIFLPDGSERAVEVKSGSRAADLCAELGKQLGFKSVEGFTISMPDREYFFDQIAQISKWKQATAPKNLAAAPPAYQLISAEFKPLEGMSSADAKHAFMQKMGELETFGCSFFEVKQSSDPSTPSTILLAVGERGVYFHMTLMKGGRLLVETTLGYKIDDLLTSYIRHLLSKTNAFRN
ncbi:Unconventional myosin-VIIb [Aphelenchoides fujianensis]|nr:Unconventional myosin-VIIb [Aphelenchoides fujianensis]